jgi:hypothetical protein
MRLALASCVVLIYGCAPTLQNELAKIGPTRAEAPLTVEDTVMAMVLAQPGVYRTASYEPDHKVIVASPSGRLTPHAIPAIDSVTFFVLDTAAIQRLADRAGDVSYLTIAVPQIGRDTVLVGIVYVRALQHIRGRARIFRGWEWCSYAVARNENRWQLGAHPRCLIS